MERDPRRPRGPRCGGLTDSTFSNIEWPIANHGMGSPGPALATAPSWPNAAIRTRRSRSLHVPGPRPSSEKSYPRSRRASATAQGVGSGGLMQTQVLYTRLQWQREPTLIVFRGRLTTG